MLRHYGKFYIGGQWVEPSGNSHAELVNPATEEPFATIAMGSAADVDRAVAAARAAFPAFSATSKQERIDMFQRIIAVYKTREADLSAAMAEEMGCPTNVRGQVSGPIGVMEDTINLLQRYSFETQRDGGIVRREAIGVCGLITPWNWPVQSIIMKLASAFAAGCTVVIKPSENSPVSALVLAEILDEAKVPAGVFNLVTGNGVIVGNAIAAHPDIDMVSFTGSTRAGVLVAQAAAPTVKRVAQELGGKSANIVLPDADLKAAAHWNVQRGFFNSSQSCHCPSRILVQENQIEEFLDYMKHAVSEIRVGDPLDEKTTIGPVVNRSQFERIQQYIRSGKEEGARLVTGGEGRPDNLNRGYYVRPTVFADVTPDMTIAREEIFGPVLCVMSYTSEEQALAIANGTEYGLGGYVFTQSPQNAKRVGNAIRAGRIFLNGADGNMIAPMGGYRKSGNGRELGEFGLEEYLEVKAIFGYPAAAAGE